MKKIVIVCASYPYGKTETFLENEINYLSDYFDIEVFPIKKYKESDVLRKNLPKNLIYHEPLITDNRKKRFLKGVFNRAPFFIYLIEFFKIFIKSTDIKKSLTNFFINMISFRTLFSNKEFKKAIKGSNTIVYFYWGNFPSGVINTNNKVYVRVHLGEIDVKRNNNYVPEFLFSKKVKYLAISSLVYHILKRKSLCVFENRLGTYNFGLNPINTSPVIRIVTCSNIIPVKRLSLVIDALYLIQDTEVEWIHFGDGVLMNEIQEYARKLPSNITSIFKGRIENALINKFYSEVPIDAFINVSLYEGVPVSIMEALSFGIPCFGTNAGATGEILNNSIGKLVDVNFGLEELVDFILQIRFNGDFRHKSRDQWEKLCYAEENYKKLVNILNESHEE